MQEKNAEIVNDLKVVRLIMDLGKHHHFSPIVLQKGAMLETGRRAFINEGMFKTWVYGRRDEANTFVPSEGDRIIHILESSGIPIEGQLIGHEKNWSPASEAVNLEGSKEIVMAQEETQLPEISLPDLPELPEIDVEKWQRRGVMAIKIIGALVLGILAAIAIVAGVLVTIAITATVGLVGFGVVAIALAGVDPRLVVVVTDSETNEQLWICILEWMDE